MIWLEEKDFLTGKTRRYVAKPKIGYEARITLVFVGDNPTPTFHYAAQVGTRHTSGYSLSIESAKQAAIDGLALLAAQRREVIKQR